MARSTLANIVTRTRRLIGDPVKAPSAGTPVWEDDELQDFLDTRRIDVTDILLEGVRSYGPASALTFLTWVAPEREWEEDGSLKDSHYNVIDSSAYTAQWIEGRWVFASEPHYPVYFSGKSFDLWGSAADVLEAWAALKPDYDFQDGSQNKFSRSQTVQARLALARSYRKKQRVMTAQMVRSDMHPDDELTNLKVLRR